jgi:hypothetical protein
LARKGTLRSGEKIDPKRCPFVKADGYQCRQTAGAGTQKLHIKGACCHFHGGHKKALSNVKHGLYSRFVRGALAKRIKAFEDDPRVMNLVPVVEVQAALLADRLHSGLRDEALEASKALAASIEKWHKVTYGETKVIRIENLQGVIDAVVSVIREFVPDKEQYPKIVNRLKLSILGLVDEHAHRN